MPNPSHPSESEDATTQEASDPKVFSYRVFCGIRWGRDSYIGEEDCSVGYRISDDLSEALTWRIVTSYVRRYPVGIRRNIGTCFGKLSLARVTIFAGIVATGLFRV